jgi:hypothetical protein
MRALYLVSLGTAVSSMKVYDKSSLYDIDILFPDPLFQEDADSKSSFSEIKNEI